MIAGMNRRSRRWALPFAALMILTAASGCARNADADDTAPAPNAATSTPTPTPTGLGWPEGAEDDTPACQDASAATLAVVNDALRSAAAEDGLVDTVLPWLSARPDQELGVWTLTGLVENAQTAVGSEGGYYVVWAARADPTAAEFSGQVYTVSSVATGLSHLDPLQPAYVGPSDMEDVPAAALSCGTKRASKP
jgi:hypothetical protein